MMLKNQDGTETFYRTLGDPSDDTLVLLHGLGADHRMWEPQMGPLVEAGYRLLVPDLLGHGRSSRVDRLSLQDWQDQLVDLLDERDVERCVPVGVSMGGAIAQAFAVNHRERVNGMVLCDTFAELGTPAAKARGFSQVVAFRIMQVLGRGALARAMAAAYKEPFAHRARDYFSEVSLEADPDQLILARKAINRIDVLGELKLLDLPALVLVGDQFGTWFIETNRKVADAIEGARFTVLKESMDPSNLVSPEAFNREVLRFLSERRER